MEVITSQNWDGVSPPALPSGWTYDVGLATVTLSGTGVTPVSSPNFLGSGDSGNWVTATYDTPDSSGGNVLVSAAFVATSTISPAGASAALFARSGAYGVIMRLSTGSIAIARDVTTSPVELVSLSTTFAGQTWYLVQFTCIGPILSVSVQGLTDSLWLQSDGSWGSVPAICLTTSNSAVSGSGTAGIMLYNDNNGYEGTTIADAFSDNFEFDSLGDILPPVFVGRYSPIRFLNS